MTDARNIETGWEIPSEGYCDQPYIVTRKDGAWVCVVTVSKGKEGAHSQHIVSLISKNHGQSWSKPVDIEPPGPPEASWAMPYMTASGRIYVFYTYNIDNIRTVIFGHDGKTTDRVDTLGAMMFKYSDDGGESWSQKHYRVPIRNFQIDLDNPYGGKVQFFWGISKPITHKNAMYLGFSKVGWFGEGFMEKDEGAFLRCPNIETETDPEKLIFETLPEGIHGVRGSVGRISDEHNLVSLNSGDLFCTFRTVSSHNCQSYSRDNGKTWSEGTFFENQPGGYPLKHPRACPAIRKLKDGRYLLWFHAHGKDYTENPGGAYVGRNPAFIAGGIEKDGFLYWSEPELLLYSKNPEDRMSYPDFVEADGELYVTETQKTIARTHHISRDLITKMFRGLEGKLAEANDFLWHCAHPTADLQASLSLKQLVPESGESFSIEAVINTIRLLPDCLLCISSQSSGIRLYYTAEHTLTLSLSDGRKEYRLSSDPLPQGTNTVTVIVDCQSKIVSFIINGRFDDGGDRRDYGFGRIDVSLGNILGDGQLFFSQTQANHLSEVRFFNRMLLTAEAVAYNRERQKEKHI